MIPVSHIPQIIDTHRKVAEPERDRWDKWHSWYMGDFTASFRESDSPVREESDEDLSLETNYPYDHIDTLSANVCPTNPQVTVRALDPSRKSIAKSRETFANEMLKRDKMKRKARRMVALASICGRSVSKTVWNRRSRMPSTSVIDPRLFFYDMSAESWEEITYCFEAVPLRRDEYEALVAKGTYDHAVASKVKATAYPEWMKDRHIDRSYLTQDNRPLFEWVVVYDFYDFTGGRFYRFPSDGKDPLLASELPYRYAPNPYSLLTFNDNLRYLDGLSDVKLIERPLERLNELDTLELRHALASIPTPQLNENAFESPEDAKSQFSMSTRPGDVAWYKLKDDRPISAALSYSTAPSMNPSFDRMRDRAESRVQRTLGTPEYARGGYGSGKLATEVSLADEATRTRNGWRIEAVQEWISSVVKKGIGIWKHELPAERNIFLLPDGEADSVQVNRHSLAFPDPEPETGSWPEDFDDDYFQYETVPYSPAENSRLVRLQVLQQFAPLLLQLPTVDKTVLTRELLDVLNLSEAALDPKAQQPTMAVPGQPGVPGSSGVQGSPEGMVQPGNSPQTEAVLPPDVRTGGGASPPALEL